MDRINDKNHSFNQLSECMGRGPFRDWRKDTRSNKQNERDPIKEGAWPVADPFAMGFRVSSLFTRSRRTAVAAFRISCSSALHFLQIQSPRHIIIAYGWRCVQNPIHYSIATCAFARTCISFFRVIRACLVVSVMSRPALLRLLACWFTRRSGSHVHVYPRPCSSTCRWAKLATHRQNGPH